jgi:tetratricopeptide (TPR) repeat protein
MGDDEAARQHAQQAVRLVQEFDGSAEQDLVPSWVGFRQGYALVILGCALERLGQPSEAADAYRRGLEQLSEDIGIGRQELGQLVGQCVAVFQRAGQLSSLSMPHQRAALGVLTPQGFQYLIECLTGLARVCLAQGDREEALAWVEELWGHLESPNLDFVPEPFQVYFTCYRVLRAVKDPRAEEVLGAAHSLLQERAARIEEEEMRRTFLEVPFHRQIAEEYADLQIREISE